MRYRTPRSVVLNLTQHSILHHSVIAAKVIRPSIGLVFLLFCVVYPELSGATTSRPSLAPPLPSPHALALCRLAVPGLRGGPGLRVVVSEQKWGPPFDLRRISNRNKLFAVMT